MRRNSRRKDSTFLDYKDGHIVAVGNNEEQEPQDETIKVTGKTINTKIIFRIFSIVIGSVLCLTLFNYVYSSTNTTMKVFNFLSSAYSTTNRYNQSYLADKKETQLQKIQNGEAFINPLDFSGKKEYANAKKTATILTEELSMIDQNLLMHYESLKTSVVAYINGDKGYLATSSSLKNLQRAVKKEYDTFTQKQLNHKELFNTLNNRYELLLNFLKLNIDDFSRDTIGNNVNELIASDNELNILEYKILKEYLDDNGLLYIEENNQIIIA